MKWKNFIYGKVIPWSEYEEKKSHFNEDKEKRRIARKRQEEKEEEEQRERNRQKKAEQNYDDEDYNTNKSNKKEKEEQVTFCTDCAKSCIYNGKFGRGSSLVHAHSSCKERYMEHLDKVVLFAVDVLNMLIIAIFAVKNLVFLKFIDLKIIITRIY